MIWRHVASNFLTLLIVILIAVAAAVAWAKHQYTAPGPSAVASCVRVPPGASVLVLPQRSYMPLGTLRGALAYPGAPDAFTPEAIDDVLKAVGLGSLREQLDETAYWADKLSGGEQQRVALARAVVNNPAIILADEPTGNLDTENSEIVLEMFRELNEKFNQTIIMITHNPEAEAVCSRIIQMRDGLIVEE